MPQAQAPPHRIPQRRRQTQRQILFESQIRTGRRPLSKRLDQRSAKTPNIAGRSNPVILQLGRIVSKSHTDGTLPKRSNRIAGEFELIADGKNIRRLQLKMHQMPAMQESQGLERRSQHLQQLVGMQSATVQNLRERLVGIFHDDKDELLVRKSIASRLEQPNQIGMIERGRPRPLLEQRIRLPPIDPHEFDGGVGEVFCLMFGQEHRPTVRGAQQAAQGIGAIDRQAGPLRPEPGVRGLFQFRVHLRIFDVRADWILLHIILPVAAS